MEDIDTSSPVVGEDDSPLVVGDNVDYSPGGLEEARQKWEDIC